MKFAHMGDCHLGSWRQPELQELNFLSFEKAIDECIKQKVEFILMAGDLFDSAYPPIEILKRTFGEFRKLKDAGIRVYMIAGSHDFSVSGKTFLDVLEKGGFCDICQYEDKETHIALKPIKHKNFEIFGYPGKKSGMEVEDIKRILLPQDNTNFRILMLHTSIKEAVGTLPIEAVPLDRLPKADYYAFAHLHINFEQKIRDKPAIYSGPIFPNSFQELEDLCYGRFYIVDVSGIWEPKKITLPIKEVVALNYEITNALTATTKIIEDLNKHELNDKIVLLRIAGILEKGTNGDIDYERIKAHLDERKVYSFLKNTNKLESKDEKIEKSDLKISSSEMSKVEEALIEQYDKNNPDKFNSLIVQLMHALEITKQEDEKTIIFETRLLGDLNKILGMELK